MTSSDLLITFFSKDLFHSIFFKFSTQNLVTLKESFHSAYLLLMVEIIIKNKILYAIF